MLLKIGRREKEQTIEVKRVHIEINGSLYLIEETKVNDLTITKEIDVDDKTSMSVYPRYSNSIDVK